MSLNGIKVTEMIKKLHGSRALGMDDVDICPDFLKALGVVGVSWLIHLCNNA